MKPVAALGLMLALPGVGGASVPAAEPVPRLSQSAVLYLENCGGCHGLQGVSAAAVVPTLRGQVGQFLCTRAGREYLVRLPSIALLPLTDGQVTDLVNFVVFDLGQWRLGPEAHPYSVEEVHRLRRSPLNQVRLAAYRDRVVGELISRCQASNRLRDYGGVAAAPNQNRAKSEADPAE